MSDEELAGAATSIEVGVKYAGYVDKQREQAQRARRYDQLPLRELDYSTVPGLSYEVRQKLGAQRPETLGQAARISGVTPAAILLLLVHLKAKRPTDYALHAA